MLFFSPHWFRLRGFAVNPSVNNCILCFYKLKVQVLRVRLSIYWGFQHNPIAPFVPTRRIPRHEGNEQKLGRQEEHRASGTGKPQANQPLFPSAGCSGSYGEVQPELYLTGKEPLGVKDDFSMPGVSGNQRWIFNACNTDFGAISAGSKLKHERVRSQWSYPNSLGNIYLLWQLLWVLVSYCSFTTSAWQTSP